MRSIIQILFVVLFTININEVKSTILTTLGNLTCYTNGMATPFAFKADLFEVDELSGENQLITDFPSRGESAGYITMETQKELNNNDYNVSCTERNMLIDLVYLNVRHNCTASGQQICSAIRLGGVGCNLGLVGFTYELDLHNETFVMDCSIFDDF
ncbi:unnamed protein product [Caenorhabditis angaria]|uniref:DUF281 domain-containing protein n=1 Tax=Caenorhabditis angaria TaxID=860376 RepID=A0A9P1N4A8_9PELO|nr:unnamed protein product [Caenorhabditis angaria]